MVLSSGGSPARLCMSDRSTSWLVRSSPSKADFLYRAERGGVPRLPRPQGRILLRRDAVARQSIGHGARPSRGCESRRQPGRSRAVLRSELGREQGLVVVGLAPHRDLLPRWPVAEDLVPVRFADGVLHARGRHAGGIYAADDRAHTGTGCAVDRNAQLLEHLEHADRGQTARAATGERQADTRRRQRAGRRRAALRGRVLGCMRCSQGAQQDDAEYGATEEM